MELHQLEYFLAVEKFRSFSTASLEISVSQSTLSQQIKKLEDELGVKLFVRTARSVRLTPAGEDFLVHARKIIQEVQNTMETIRNYTTYNKGLIRIGTFSNIVCWNLHDIVIKFLNHYPGIDYELCEASPDELFRLLYEKKINIAFILSPFPENIEFGYNPLFSEQEVMLVSKKHPLAEHSEVDLSALAKQNMLIANSSSFYRDYLEQVCHDAGFVPKVVYESNDALLLQHLVSDGIGVALMGYSMAKFLQTDRLSIVPLRQQLKRQIGLAIPKYARYPLLVKLFRDFTLKELSAAQTPQQHN